MIMMIMMMTMLTVRCNLQKSETESFVHDREHDQTTGVLREIEEGGTGKAAQRMGKTASSRAGELGRATARKLDF